MKNTLLIFILFSIFTELSAQLYLNNGGKIRIDGGTSANPIFVVLNTPPATPIVTNGTGNGIIMEAEYNRLQYNLGTGATAITVPYMSLLNESLPLTLTPSTPGTGAGNIRFSAVVPPTRATGWDNSTYMPSDVTNMNALPAVTNNSAKTIDRFWIIDANGYTTKPAVTLAFTYLDLEHAANGSNTITEANLRAQRFNPTLSPANWGGYTEYLPQGTINVGANTVTGVVVSGANFFKSWTLNDNSIPLPIELINFEAKCVNNETVLEWCTASETNTHYFTIEHSTDGVEYTPLGNVFAYGTSNSKHCYKFMSTANAGNLNYYRLSHTDFNKASSISKVITIDACGKNNGNATITNTGTRQVGLLINSLTDATYQLAIYNTLGQAIEWKTIDVKQGENTITVDLQQVAEAVYYATLFNNEQVITSKKIIVSDWSR